MKKLAAGSLIFLILLFISTSYADIPVEIDSSGNMYVIYQEPSLTEFTHVIEKIGYLPGTEWFTSREAAFIRMVLVKSGRQGTDGIVHGFGYDDEKWSIYYIRYRGTDGILLLGREETHSFP